MTDNLEKIVALFERAADGVATWHDFTQAFGTGSEHDPAVLGLRAYGGSVEAGEKLVKATLPKCDWSVSGYHDGAYGAIVIRNHDVIAAGESNQSAGRALLLAVLVALIKVHPR